MFYRKNIYLWEQWSRVIFGLATAGLSLAFATGMAKYIIAAMGLGLAVTGIVGWCPACAMIDRQLKDKH